MKKKNVFKWWGVVLILLRDSCWRNRDRFVILAAEKEGITMKTTIILFLLSVPVWAVLAYASLPLIQDK